MTPKEKADDLVQKMYSFVAVENGITCVLRAKFLAITCLKEIIATKPSEPRSYNDTLGYWNEVLTELEKL